MNPIGINLMVWSGTVDRTVLDRLPGIKAWGYQGVEVPVFAPDSLDVALIRAAIGQAGLRCTVSTALPKNLSLIDAAVSEAGVAWLGRVIDVAAALGADLVCGPLALPVGALRGRGYTPAEWDCGVQSFKRVGQMASDHGVVLAFEPLNRFETFFLNTVTAGVRLMEAVDHPAVGLLLDTFHLNIEERSIPRAIRHAGSHLKHFHCSENDRGTVGTGHVPWPEVFAALRAVGYDGWLTVESFGAAIPELAAAACVWRPLAASPEALAEDSLHFIQQQSHGRV